MLEKFNMPMVVRQKGLIDDTLKVYIESRVIQYIKELKEKTKAGNRYGVLVGKVEQIEEEDCLVISGIIKCNCKKVEDLDDYFMKQVRGYIEEQAVKYFPNNKIIGLVSIDKENSNRDEQIVKNFKKIFKTDYNILFIQNKYSEELCYTLKEKVEGLKGYFVFYEKNEDMKRYALENEIEIITNPVMIENKGTIENFTRKRINKAPSLINVSLFLLCMILGFGLIQNLELTRKLETKMKAMSSSANLEILRDDNIVNNSNVENTIETNDNHLKEKLIEVKDEDIPKTENFELSEIVETSAIEENDNANEAIEQVEEYQYYTIEKGDNLKGISRKFFGSEVQVSMIKELNNIDNENYIRVGEVLKLPIIN